MMVALALLFMIVMVVALALLIVIVMMVMALALLVVIVMMVVMMVVMMRLLHQLIEDRSKSGRPRRGIKDLAAGQRIPGCRNNNSSRVVLTEQCHGRRDRSLIHVTGARKHDRTGMLDLIIEKFAEVFHIHPAFLGIDHNGGTPKLGIRKLQPLHGTDHVAQLTDARRLDQNAVGGIIVNDLPESAAEIANEATADTAGIHLVDRHTGLAKEASVNADLAEFVFDEDEPFTGIRLSDQLLDQGRLPCTEKAGKNINFCHDFHFLNYVSGGKSPARPEMIEVMKVSSV